MGSLICFEWVGTKPRFANIWDSIMWGRFEWVVKNSLLEDSIPLWIRLTGNMQCNNILTHPIILVNWAMAMSSNSNVCVLVFWVLLPLSIWLAVIYFEQKIKIDNNFFDLIWQLPLVWCDCHGLLFWTLSQVKLLSKL
jgi:hypothetical protein